MQLRPAHRRLLASLLLDAGNWVTTDTLIDRMWGETPPETSRSTLHVHLSAVRRQLPEVLVTGQSSYLLDLDGHTFDVAEFSSLVSKATEQMENGRLREASDLAAKAKSIWRGRPYQELDDVDTARAERARLIELSSTASVTLARALMLQGRGSESIFHLRAMVEEQPFNEAMWEELIHAYYLAGRQVDALDAYQQAKRVLGEELGLEPGPRLRHLEEQVLLHDPRLLEGSAAAIGAMGGIRPKSLPGFTTPFFQRSKLMRGLSKAVTEHRLMTLVGIGGLGKTRLAVEAARRAAHSFSDGVAFVPFEAVDSPDLIVPTISESVARREISSVESLTSVIGGRDLLLVLDNCEHLIEPLGDVVVRLLEGCPSLSVLATSRTPLGVTGESTWAVDPLDLPADNATLAQLRRTESVMFFVEAARRVQPDLTLSVANGSSIAQICRDLVGIPLALELAASHSDVLTPGDIGRLLGEASHVMRRADTARPARHRSLDDTVDWSLSLLDPADRRLFERMAVFASAVEWRAIEAVAADPEDALLSERLRRLAHASLITVDIDGESARYGQLPPIKQAAARRVSAEEWDDLRRAHANYFIDLASSPVEDAGTPEERFWFNSVDDAIEELRAAFELARDLDPLSGMRAAVRLAGYWHSGSRVVEGRHHIQVLRASAVTAPLEDEVAALKVEGTLAYAMSDLEDAERLLLLALQAAGPIGDQAQMAAILNNLGVVAVDAGDLELALDRYTTARASLQELDDRPGLAATALNLGVVELQMEHPDAARAWFQTALDGFRKLNNRREESNALERLSHVAYYEGDIEEARSWLQASRRISVEMRLPERVGGADWLLARMALDSAEVDTATELAVESARTAQNLEHHTWWTPQLLETSAQIAAARGAPGHAASLVGAASAFRRATGATRPAFSNAEYEEFVDSLRTEVGGGYPAALAAGEGMSVREALRMIERELPNVG